MTNKVEGVKVKEIFRSKWRVCLEVSGKSEDVSLWIKEYELYWPSGGYGTFAKQMATFENGEVIFEVSRSTSCD